MCLFFCSAHQTGLASFPEDLQNCAVGLERPLGVILQSHFSAIRPFVFKKGNTFIVELPLELNTDIDGHLNFL